MSKLLVPKIPLLDIDWTLLVGNNKVHLDSFSFMFAKVFNKPAAKISDIDYRGKIDSQIIVEVLKTHGVSEEESTLKLHQAFALMNEYYKCHEKETNVVTLPGVKQLLQKLQELDILTGVLSGNIEQIAWKKLSKGGIRKYFSFGAFGDMAMRRVDLVKVAQKQIKDSLSLEVPVTQFVIVGDTPLDVACAKEAGIASIAVASGSYSVDRLKDEGADLVLKNLEEIDTFISFLTDH